MIRFLTSKLIPIKSMDADQVEAERRARDIERQQTENAAEQEIKDNQDSFRHVWAGIIGNTFEKRYKPKPKLWPELVSSGNTKDFAVFRNQVDVFMHNSRIDGWAPFSDKYGGHTIAWYICKAMQPDLCEAADQLEFIPRDQERPITPKSNNRAVFTGAPVGFFVEEGEEWEKKEEDESPDINRGLFIGLQGNTAWTLSFIGSTGFKIDQIDLSTENLVARWA